MKSKSFLERLELGRKFSAMDALQASTSSCLYVARANKESGVAVTPGKNRCLSNVSGATA